MKTSQVGRIPRPPATAKSTNSSHYSTVLCMAQGSGSYGRGYVNPRLKREVQSRQRKARELKYEKQRVEWDEWERNIEIEESKKKVGREREDRARDVSFGRKRWERSSPKKSMPFPPGHEREDEARRASYVRQRLFQKVNGFSQMVQEIQMAQQERVDSGKPMEQLEEQQEEYVMDSLVRTLRNDTCDTWDW